MKNTSSETIENTSTLFDTIDLNEDIKKIYELIDDEKLYDELEEQTKLSKLRNENHKRYHNINELRYHDLPHDFDNIVNNIFNLYNSINSKTILSDDSIGSNNTKILLDEIYALIEKLDIEVELYLKDITEENDLYQDKFNLAYFNELELDESLKKKIIDKYNDLVLYTSYITEDIYEDLKRQVKRKDYINEILKLLNKEDDNKQELIKQDELITLNSQIDNLIIKYKEQIQYLEDIIPNKSKYLNEFNNFKNYYNSIIAYDDMSYESVKKAFEILSDELRFKTYVSNFEELFTQEIIDKQKEETFIYENIGIKNLRNSLDYITANYMDKLDEECKGIIGYIFNKLNRDVYDLEELNKALNLIVKIIWNNTITDVYSFNPNEDYYFICSNNQFIDEKYQTILITKKEIDRVDDYDDYQIGFICGYNDNILYITENDDIMTVDSNDLSNLKTPLQLEQEFINFKVCNRIALNGYKTKIEAVYYINDGNMDKYIKALELANTHKLPLIELKK